MAIGDSGQSLRTCLGALALAAAVGACGGNVWIDGADEDGFKNEGGGGSGPGGTSSASSTSVSSSTVSSSQSSSSSSTGGGGAPSIPPLVEVPLGTIPVDTPTSVDVPPN